MRPGPIVLRMLELTGKERPRVCLVMTATGDDSGYLAASYEALGSLGCDVTHLALFPQPNADPEERLCGSDVVWVGGGSVANLLAVWRLHGVDDAMRAAWEGGTVLGGVSAGAICWHVGGTTDSFGPTLRPVTDGLGLLPFGCGVHYDSEEQRRPLLHELVGAGALPTAFATDDGVGILHEGTEPVEVVADRSGGDAAAYRVERTAAGVVETRLAPGRL
ncbi:MAG: Type 1 glutamine amidotransferase-like domain-containing protein [Actinomycetota bacterium]